VQRLTFFDNTAIIETKIICFESTQIAIVYEKTLRFIKAEDLYFPNKHKA